MRATECRNDRSRETWQAGINVCFWPASTLKLPGAYEASVKYAKSRLAKVRIGR